jgi:hypothetical protein
MKAHPAHPAPSRGPGWGYQSGSVIVIWLLGQDSLQ